MNCQRRYKIAKKEGFSLKKEGFSSLMNKEGTKIKEEVPSVLVVGRSKQQRKQKKQKKQEKTLKQPLECILGRLARGDKVGSCPGGSQGGSQGVARGVRLPQDHLAQVGLFIGSITEVLRMPEGISQIRICQDKLDQDRLGQVN